jgi:hypothetical protein
MSPEKTGMLVVLDLKKVGTDKLKSVTEQITAEMSELPVYVDWTSIKEPQGAAYTRVGRGVAYVRFEKSTSKPQPITRVERLVSSSKRPNTYPWEN